MKKKLPWLATWTTRCPISKILAGHWRTSATSQDLDEFDRTFNYQQKWVDETYEAPICEHPMPALPESCPPCRCWPLFAWVTSCGTLPGNGSKLFTDWCQSLSVVTKRETMGGWLWNPETSWKNIRSSIWGCLSFLKVSEGLKTAREIGRTKNSYTWATNCLPRDSRSFIAEVTS